MREGEEEVFNRREDEEAGEEAEREEKEEEEKEKKVVVSEKELMATEGEEEEQVKPESRQRAEEAQEVQMEDNKTENNKETIADKPEDKEEREEKKKSRKRRGKKQSERVRNRRGLKDVSERFEEEKRSQIQEVSAMSSGESSALSEPPIGLMNSCDLSDPVYLGCGSAGLYCPPAPIPLLYSSQPTVPIQPAPPQPHGTKRPHSPLPPHSLPQQGPQPLEVRKLSLALNLFPALFNSLTHRFPLYKPEWIDTSDSSVSPRFSSLFNYMMVTLSERFKTELSIASYGCIIQSNGNILLFNILFLSAASLNRDFSLIQPGIFDIFGNFGMFVRL